MAKSYYERGKKSIRTYLDTKTDHVGMTVPKGTKDLWMAAAEAAGTTMTSYVREALDRRIQGEIISGTIPDVRDEAVRAEVLAQKKKRTQG